MNDLSPETMNNIFQNQENCYVLLSPMFLVSKQKLTITYGMDSISFRCLQSSQNLSQEIEIFDWLNFFKFNVKRSGTLKCHCRVCKMFLSSVGWLILWWINLFTIYKVMKLCNFGSILISNLSAKNALSIRNK